MKCGTEYKHYNENVFEKGIYLKCMEKFYRIFNVKLIFSFWLIGFLFDLCLFEGFHSKTNLRVLQSWMLTFSLGLLLSISISPSPSLHLFLLLSSFPALSFSLSPPHPLSNIQRIHQINYFMGGFHTALAHHFILFDPWQEWCNTCVDTWITILSTA